MVWVEILLIVSGLGMWTGIATLEHKYAVDKSHPKWITYLTGLCLAIFISAVYFYGQTRGTCITLLETVSVYVPDASFEDKETIVLHIEPRCEYVIKEYMETTPVADTITLPAGVYLGPTLPNNADPSSW